MPLRKTKEEFINKAIELHGDKYDYSKVNYVNISTKITIICKEHGDFLQTPRKHFMKQGCIKCGITTRANNQRSCTEKFIEKSIKKHSDKYDYSKVDYIDSKTKVIIICKQHGEFVQTPNSHLLKQGCIKCATVFNANNRRCDKEEFIEKAITVHGDTYDYSKVNYENALKKITIICKQHGEFVQTPNKHLMKQGCIKCSGKYSNTTNEFIEKAITVHGDTYDYSKVNYVSRHAKIIIICKKHGDFLQAPTHHLNKSGCPLCFNKTEGIIFKKLQLTYPNIVTQFKQNWCRKNKYLPFDLCIPKYKVIIELDGPQHFKQVKNWISPEQQFQTDKYKEKCANDNGYSVIRILQEDVLYDRYDWHKEILDTVEGIKNDCHLINYYLCKNNEYISYSTF
jgi:very-short-patch-repair endonuclease